MMRQMKVRLGVPPKFHPRKTRTASTPSWRTGDGSNISAWWKTLNAEALSAGSSPLLSPFRRLGLDIVRQERNEERVVALSGKARGLAGCTEYVNSVFYVFVPGNKTVKRLLAGWWSE